MEGFQMILDKIVVNANVLTMNSKAPLGTAFGICRDRFQAVGSEDEIQPLAGKNTEIIDLGGKTVVPGFIESHNHMSMYAATLLQADCSPSSNRNIADVKANIRQLAEETAPNQWVKGWGYDDTLIAEKRHLTRLDLDEASRQHPVFILHISAHLAYANSKALEIAGIGPETPQPEGGEIHKDTDGNPTGLLLEPGAIRLVGGHPCIPCRSLRRCFLKRLRITTVSV
jgi:predicted amidohydrolase YtcJ